MKKTLIDWNEVWRKAGKEEGPERDPDFWDRRAPEFARHATAGDYVDQFIAIMKPEPQWSVLDVGSAAGTLAVPLAPMVQSITAVDPSTAMLSLLARRCGEVGIGNVRAVSGRWEDDWDELGIGVHDAAISSRSLFTDLDLREAILKLETHARRRVYISTLVDDGPHDRRIFEAVGREFHPGPDYIIIYNLLRQMGICANAAFTVNRIEKTYSDVEDAVNSLRWMIPGMNVLEEARLEEHLSRCLVEENGRWKLPYCRIVRWAVLWWEKD